MADLVGLHVAAKRYLAATEEYYRSAASRQGARPPERDGGVRGIVLIAPEGAVLAKTTYRDWLARWSPITFRSSNLSWLSPPGCAV